MYDNVTHKMGIFFVDNLESLKVALSVDFLEDPQDDVSMCLLARGM